MIQPHPVAAFAPPLAARAATRVRPLRASVLLLLCGGLFALLPLTPHPGLYALVLLMFVAITAPGVRDWYQGRLDLFEPIHVIGVLYFIYFGLGAIWTVGDPTLVAYDLYIVPYIPRAVAICVFGWVALLVGYYGPWLGPPRRRSYVEHVRGTVFLLVVGALGFAGYLAVAISQRATTLEATVGLVVSTATQLWPLFIFGWALIWILVYSGRIEARQRLVWLGLFVPGAIVVALLTLSNKSLLLLLGGVPLIAFWYGRKRLPWLFLLVLLLVVVFVVFPFYNTYRLIDPHLEDGQRISMTYNTLQNWSGTEYVEQSIGGFKRRMALINSIAVVVRDVPRWVPYKMADRIFMPALAFFVPRAFWPDKPRLNLMGREFGEQFRIVSALDSTTFIAPTYPGELYWAMDLPGVLLGMGLWGLGIRVLYRRYGRFGASDPVRCAVYIVVLAQLAMFEGALAPGLVVLVRTLIILEGLRWVARRAGWVEIQAVSAAGKA